jgi:hypothetical protein
VIPYVFAVYPSFIGQIAYVEAALRGGAKPYTARILEEKKDDDKESAPGGVRSGLRFAAYATPSSNTYEDPLAPSFDTPDSSSPSSSSAAAPSLDVSRVVKRWGPEGYNDDSIKEVPVASTPVPSAAASSTLVSSSSGGSSVSTTPGGLSGGGSWTAGPISGGPFGDAPKPKKEIQLSAEEEKKKATALALFAGIGGTPTTAATAAPKRVVPSTSPAVGRTPSVVVSTPAKVAAPTSSPPAAAASTFDIFGSLASAFESAPVVTPTLAPAPVYTPVAAPQVAAVVSPATGAPKRAATIDPFGDMFGDAFGGGGNVPSLLSPSPPVISSPSYGMSGGYGSPSMSMGASSPPMMASPPMVPSPAVMSSAGSHDPFAFINGGHPTPAASPIGLGGMSGMGGMPSLSIYGAEGMSPVMKARLSAFPK